MAEEEDPGLAEGGRMNARPLLFSTPMVRALLEGRKTQTRRIVKPVRGYEHNNVCRPDMGADPWAVWWHGESERVGSLQECPYGKPGDLLYVRETSLPDFPKSFSYYEWSWAEVPAEYRTTEHVLYKADWTGSEMRWNPSIHMPRWASRLTLRITDVRVERLQEISEADAIAEGIGCENVIVDVHCSCGRHSEVTAERYFYDGCTDDGFEFAEDAYAALWDSINFKSGFGCGLNPWVWAISFEVIQKNVDAVLKEAA